MVRIPAFHVGGPGLIPGVGTNVKFEGQLWRGLVLAKPLAEGRKHTTLQEAPTQATCAMAAW